MLRVGELADIICGRIFYGTPETLITGVVSDSKAVKRGDCFVAIKGERFNGNDFIGEAIENGAAAVLSEALPSSLSLSESVFEEKNIAFIVTESVYVALQKAAKYYREKHLENVVSVTGSVGKTTVKELIYSVLSQKMDIIKTEGNKNNLLGLPLTILSGKKSKNAVTELGISNFGEMSILSSIAKPSVAIITNIGKMHIENLGSRENIAREKLKITLGMKSRGTLIINGDEPLLTELLTAPFKLKTKQSRAWPSEAQSCEPRLRITEPEVNVSESLLPYEKTVTVSEKNKLADYFVCNVSSSSRGTFFDIRKNGKEYYKKLFVPIYGKHGALSAAFAVAVGEIFECSEELVRRGLHSFTTCGDRQRLEEISGSLYLFDCYNAGPESFFAALEAFKMIAAEKNIKYRGVVAGSMLELGEISEREHISLGEMIAKTETDFLITVGKEAKFIACGAEKNGMDMKKITVLTDEKDIFPVVEELKRKNKAGSLVLIKGSRGIRLERLRDLLEDG